MEPEVASHIEKKTHILPTVLSKGVSEEGLEVWQSVTDMDVKESESSISNLRINDSESSISDLPPLESESSISNLPVPSEDSLNKETEGSLSDSGTMIDEKKSGDEEKEDEEEWMDILGSGQLMKKIIRKAENSYRPQHSHICKINLEGCLTDGTIVDKYDGLHIQIGDAEIVRGLDLTLPLMNVGELVLLEIGPKFAYSSLGREPDIPPDSKITYTLELLSAEPEPDMETLPVAKRKNIGCLKRERGNWWYTRQEHILAIQCYRRALDYLDDVEGGITLKSDDGENVNRGSEEEVKELLEDRLKVFNNLAAAQMKIKAYDTALQSVENVLRCQPNNMKALFRKGKILAAKGDISNSVRVLRLASQLEPDNRMVRQELVRMLTIHKEDTMHEKNLYKKMLGQDRQPDSSPKHSKFQFPWGVLFGSFAALLAGVVAYRYKFS